MLRIHHYFKEKVVIDGVAISRRKMLLSSLFLIVTCIAIFYAYVTGHLSDDLGRFR